MAAGSRFVPIKEVIRRDNVQEFTGKCDAGLVGGAGEHAVFDVSRAAGHEAGSDG